VYDFVSSRDEGLIVMEYVQGESLDRLMAQDLVPTAAATSILADVAAALTHAHERGVVHRDVKPSNVIVAPDGQAKLTDFGLARLLASSSALRTRPGTVMGTPEYMAPEQILGEDTDERTDAYAFAAMAYALLTRRPVFDRSDRRPMLDAHPCSKRRYHPRTRSPDFRRPRRTPSSQGSRKGLHSARWSPTSPTRSRASPQTRVPSSRQPESRHRPEPAPMRTEGGAPLDQIIVAHHEAVDGGETASLTVPVFVPPRSPDGERTAIQTLRVAGGRTPAHADLRFTVKGETATEVVAKLEVLSPEPVSASSPPARYFCR
jgi:serine/threonine protein kinase